MRTYVNACACVFMSIWWFCLCVFGCLCVQCVQCVWVFVLLGWMFSCICNSGIHIHMRTPYESHRFHFIRRFHSRLPCFTPQHMQRTLHTRMNLFLFLLFVFCRIHRHCVSHSLYLSQWTALRRTQRWHSRNSYCNIYNMVERK